MLELRPNCEWCDVNLGPDADDARICTYECTFCARCVDEFLHNVCPNCGGGFSARPIRSVTARRDNTSLAHQPASTKRRHSSYSRQEVVDFVAMVKTIDPRLR